MARSRNPSQVLRLDGFKEWDQQLRKMRGRDLIDAVAEAAYRAVDPVLYATMALAPRGTAPLRRGRARIATSIKKAVTSRGESGIVSVAVGVDTRAFHARFLEHGTKPHFARRKGRAARRKLGETPVSLGLAPRPFLRPAWQAQISRVMELFKSELQKRIG